MHPDIVPRDACPIMRCPSKRTGSKMQGRLRSNVELTHGIIVWPKTPVSHLRYVIRGRLFLQTPELGVARISQCRCHLAAVRDVRFLDWIQNLIAIITTPIADPVLTLENERRPSECRYLPFDRLEYSFHGH